MKTITTNNRTLLFVEVPEDADRFVLIHCRTRLAWFYPTYKRIDLPDTDYDRKFIATTDNIPADLGITDTLLAEHGITGRHAIIEVL